jgi:hypothetical protein
MYRMLTTACPWLLLTLILPTAMSDGPDDDDQVRASYSSGEWRGSDHEWTISRPYNRIRDYADRPDDQTLKSLTIEWQKPELDALGNFCTIRGQLKTPDNGQHGTKPITWFQGVTVYMAMTFDAKPDWSKEVNQVDAMYEIAATSPSGKFRVYFDLRESSYDRTRAQYFQFGVALAKHVTINKTSQNVVWSSRTPVIPSTVQMLYIPAAPRLSRELQLINRASRWPFTNPNGVELIRAVNGLRSLGKERALAVLEEYLKLAQGSNYFSAEPKIVFWIIRLLFEPIRLDDRIPPPGIAVFLVDRESVEAMKWPLNPMAVSGDVPFMVGRQIAMGGQPEPPSSHIRWARLHGVIRDDPLVPRANPLAAAEAILASRRLKALDEYSRVEATRGIRLQALAMVKGLLQPLSAREAARDDRWRALLKAATERGIDWDAKREQFVARE